MLKHYTTYAQNFKCCFKHLRCIIVVVSALGFIFNFTEQCNAQSKNYTVEEIVFNGNKSVSEKALLKTLNVKIPVRVDSAGIYGYAARIIDHYRANGYYFARIESVELLESVKPNGYQLSINIAESGKVLVNRIDVQSTDTETEKIITKDIRSGDVFSEVKLNAAIDNAVRSYEESGNPYVVIRIKDISFNSSQDSDNLLVDISIEVQKGKQVAVDTLAVSGNEITRPGILIRESRINIGERFNEESLKKAREYIRKLSYIERAGYPLLFETPDGRSLIELPVKERKPNLFNGILGYIPSRQEEDGYYIGSFEINLGNIAGTGRKFQAEWNKLDISSQRLMAYYEEPWAAGLPVNLSIRIEQSLQDSSFIKREFSFGGNFDLNSSVTAFLSVGGQQIIAENSGRSLYNLKNSRSLKYTAGLAYDKMDYRLNPRKGVYYSTFVTEQIRKITEESAGPDEDEFRDRKIEADLEAALPVRGSLVGFLGVSWKQTTNSKRDIPVSQRWYLGGATSLRGYREKQFQASSISWYNFEIRYLLDNNSRIFLFHDGGFFQNPGESMKRKFGYGFGMRLNSRIGLIGFDLGIGEGDTFSTAKLHIGIQTFF